MPDSKPSGGHALASLRDLVEWVARSAHTGQRHDIPDPVREPDAFHTWVSETTADLSQPHPEQVIGLSLPSLPSLGWPNPSDIPSEIASLVLTPIEGILNPLSTTVNEVYGTVNSISKTVTGIPGDVAAVGTDVSKVVTTLGSGLEGWLGEVGVAATHTLGAWGADVATKVQQLESTIKADITNELQRAGTQLKPLIDHLVLVRRLDEHFEYSDRFTIATNSLAVLVKKASSEVNDLSTLMSSIKPVLFGSGDDRSKATEEAIEALADLLLYLVQNMNPVTGVISRLLPAPGQTTSVFQRLFPFWIPPGTLRQWLNAEGDFGLAQFNGADSAKALQLAAEERAFRRELVAAVDRYLRTTSVGFGTLLRSTDQRSSVEALLDLFNVLCSTFFGFVLRCPGMPSTSLTKMPFAYASPVKARSGDIGSDVAAAVSRQIVQPMKSALGVVLNGLWAVSPNNQPLVEAVSGTLTHLVRSVLECLLNGVFWSVEIRETYPDGTLDPESELGPGWPSIETYKTGGTTQALQYRVYRRAGLLDVVSTPDFTELVTSSLVTGLLQDYASYRDAISEYSGFGVAQEVDKVHEPTTSFDTAQQAIDVKVTVDSNGIDLRSVPVIRAYYNGVPTVLTCANTQGDQRQYEGRIELAPQDGRVWVVSNYGGMSYTGLRGK